MSNLSKRLVFNKYRVKKLIATTPFGWIYDGVNEKNNEPVALKFEKIGGKYNLLEGEAYFLFNLKGYGLPKIISFGKTGFFNCLIEELLGITIEDLWESKKMIKNYKLKYVCMLALQVIDRLEYIHSRSIIHRDMKANNLVIGRKDPETIYLIDFGFARKYRSSRTGKHIKFKNLKKAIGNLRYISINGNRGYEQSRRDDLEALGYMLIYLANNSLPWVNPEISKMDNKVQKFAVTLRLKQSTKPEQLCTGLPIEFLKYINYCRNLEFEQDPNYDYIRDLFMSILTRTNQLKDYSTFFWIINKKRNLSDKGRNEDNRCNYFKRKGSSQKRLYNQIKNSLQKAKSQDLSKLLNFNFMKLQVEKKSNSCDKSLDKDNNFFIKNNEHKKKIIDNYNINNKKNIVNVNKLINNEQEKNFKKINNTNAKNEIINSNKFFNRNTLKFINKASKRNSYNNMNNKIERKINLDIKNGSFDYYNNNTFKMNKNTANNSNNNISKDILPLNTDLDKGLKLDNKIKYRTIEERKKEKSKNNNNSSNKNNISLSIDKFNYLHILNIPNNNSIINNNYSMNARNTSINKNSNIKNNNVMNINNIKNNNNNKGIYKINRNKDNKYLKIKSLKSDINLNEEKNKKTINMNKLGYKINKSIPLLNIQNNLQKALIIKKKISPIITTTNYNFEKNHKKINSLLNQQKLNCNKKQINSNNTNNIYIMPNNINVSLNLNGLKGQSKFKSYNIYNLDKYNL